MVSSLHPLSRELLRVYIFSVMSGRTVTTFLAILAQLVLGGKATRFSILNNCPYTVWIGATPAAGLIMFDINQGELLINDLDDSWRGKLFFRTHCGANSNGDFHCIIGDCGKEECDGNLLPQPPVTTLEFLSSGGNNNSLFSYAVNLEHGFNVPVSIVPQGEGKDGCRPTGCSSDLTKVCPQELKVIIDEGNTIGCNSDCEGFHKPEDCCIGDFSRQGDCKPSRTAQLFKQICPQAHTWTFDGGVESCAAAIFNITLCP